MLRIQDSLGFVYIAVYKVTSLKVCTNSVCAFFYETRFHLTHPYQLYSPFLHTCTLVYITTNALCSFIHPFQFHAFLHCFVFVTSHSGGVSFCSGVGLALQTDDLFICLWVLLFRSIPYVHESLILSSIRQGKRSR